MKRLSLVVLAALITLPACETFEGMKEDFSQAQDNFPSFGSSDKESSLLASSCPKVVIVEELSELNEFADISNTSPDNLVSSATLNAIENSCTKKTKTVTVNMKLAFDGKLGPKARMFGGVNPSFSYPYFVAIVSPSGDIMAKEVFAASLNFGSGASSANYYESLRQIIPVKHGTNSGKYKVLVGFQLTHEQLAYNRAQAALEEAAQVEPAAAETSGAAPPTTQTQTESRPIPSHVNSIVTEQDANASTGEPINITVPSNP